MDMARERGGGLTATQFQQADGVEDWRVLGAGADAWFAAPSHTAGAALLGRIAELSGDDGGPPDVDVRARGVRVQIHTPDVALARAISVAARELGLVADPAALQTMRLVIDTPGEDAVAPFWSAALGYRRAGDTLLDPLRRNPAIAFQAMDSPRPLRDRFHLDIGVPYAADVLAALAEAGAVETFRADYYVTVADPDGNAVCLPVFDAAHLAEGAELADWRAIGAAIVFYPTTSFGQSAELAVAVTALADELGKPVLVDLRPDGVVIDSAKDQQEDENFDIDAGFMELARRIQAAARGMGLTADPTGPRFLQIAIDAVDVPAVRAFWTAVLGYRQDPRLAQDIYDPRRLDPVCWFQQMDAEDEARRAQRNRIHIDLFLPHDHARARIDAALAAGGRIRHDRAPALWTLVDPEGNEVDIITSAERIEHA